MSGFDHAHAALAVGHCLQAAQSLRAIDRQSGIPLVMLALSQRCSPASVSLPLRMSAWGEFTLAGSTAAVPYLLPKQARRIRVGLLLRAVVSIWTRSSLGPMLHPGYLLQFASLSLELYGRWFLPSTLHHLEAAHFQVRFLCAPNESK